MRDLAILLYLSFVALLSLLPSTRAQETPAPDAIPDLAAWYHTHELHEELNEGGSVKTWKDMSGNGHDLVDDEKGRPAVLRVNRIHKRPVVEVRS